MLKNDLLELQKKLIELTNKQYELGCYGKIGEPNICIGLTNELKWYAEIYSYVLEFDDGGRHHYFEADTYEELIKKLWNVIHDEEKVLNNEGD